jgi:hypothetical protein
MRIGSGRLFRAGMAALFAVLLCCNASEARAPQGKATLLSGTLYKVHAGFLEIKSGEKQIDVVKVDSTTVYWDGKTDKAASKKDLGGGDELMVEIVRKNGVTMARKVRFMHRGS